MFTPSTQQIEIQNQILAGNNVQVIAAAGSGKTTTIMYVAENLPKKSLYLVFNKKNEIEATDKFSKKGLTHVRVQTLFSLAYQSIVTSKNWRAKLKANLLNREEVFPELQKHLGFKEKAFFISTILNTIKEFCNSEYYSISEFISQKNEKKYLIDSKMERNIISHWEKLIDENNPCSINHAIYFKLFHLRKTQLDFEIIYVDEFQDSNPVTIDIILNQKCQIVVIGDPYQAIYQFRGAVAAFDYLPTNFQLCYLTESYRFGENISNFANNILNLSNCSYEVVGLAKPSSEIKTKCFISKTNAGTLRTLVSLHSSGLKANFIGDLKETFNKLWGIICLRAGKVDKVYDLEIKSYKTIENLVKEAENNTELKGYLNILKAFNDVKNLQTICDETIAKDGEKTDFWVTTAHRSKGFEWDNVCINNDFNLFAEDEEELLEKITPEYLNLLYVAVTRAKQEVNFFSDLARQLANGQTPSLSNQDW